MSSQPANLPKTLSGDEEGLWVSREGSPPAAEGSTLAAEGCPAPQAPPGESAPVPQVPPAETIEARGPAPLDEIVARVHLMIFSAPAPQTGQEPSAYELISYLYSKSDGDYEASFCVAGEGCGESAKCCLTPTTGLRASVRATMGSGGGLEKVTLAASVAVSPALLQQAVGVARREGGTGSLGVLGSLGLGAREGSTAAGFVFHLKVVRGAAWVTRVTLKISAGDARHTAARFAQLQRQVQ